MTNNRQYIKQRKKLYYIKLIFPTKYTHYIKDKPKCKVKT